MSSETLTPVSKLVKCGFPVFPVDEDKSPKKGWKWKDSAISEPDHGMFHAWDRWAWPVSRGHVVIDIDKPDLFPWHLIEHHTARQKSPNGHHILCIDTNPNGPAQERHEWGEIRRAGTYMVMWPTPGYVISEDWLRWECEPLPSVWGNSSKENGSQGSTLLSVPTDYSETLKSGQRNIDLTSFAGHIWQRHDDEPELAANLVQLKGDECGLPQNEINGIIKQMITWQGSHIDVETKGQPTGDIKDVYDLEHEGLPEFTWWRQPFGPGQAIMMYGLTGSGKSYWLLASVYEFNKEHIGKVLWLDGEMSWRHLKERIGTNNEPQWLYMAKPDGNDWLTWDYEEYSMIVIDTKSGLYHDPKYTENDMEHWQPLNEFIKKWVAKGKCVVLVHHSNKAKGSRGSSNCESIVDSSMEIAETENGEFMVTMHKDRHGLCLPKLRYELKKNKHGHPVMEMTSNL